MTLFKDELYVGEDPAQHAIVWASGDPGDNHSASNLTRHFSADRDGSGNWVLRNENTDTTVQSVHRDSNQVTFHAPVRISDRITGSLHLGGDRTRLTGFDANNEHIFRQTSTDSDSILALERTDTSDYDLWLFQNGARERVHTTGDTDIDADSLGGRAPGAYAALSDDETITGAWTTTRAFTSERGNNDTVFDITHSDGTIATGLELRITSSDNYAFMPVSSGSLQSGRAFTWVPSANEWRFATTDVYAAGNRLLHTGDDGTLDAATLGGTAPSAFAELSAAETVDGGWEHTSPLTLATAIFDSDAHVEASAIDTLRLGTGTSWPLTINTATGDVTTDGTITAGGNTVLTTATGFPALEDSGTQILSGAESVNFGADFDVTDDGGNAATVSFVGGSLPDDVYQDGSLVGSDVNGIDFYNEFDITTNADNVAEVRVATSDLASLSSNETVTGNWLFDGDLKSPTPFKDTTIAGSNYPLGLSTMSIGSSTNYPGSNTAALTVQAADNRLFQVGGGNGDFWFRRYHSSTGWTSFNRVWTDQNDGAGSGLNADLLDGRDSNVYAELDVAERITGNWTTEGAFEIERADEFAFHFNPNGADAEQMYGGWTTSTEWALSPHDGGTWDPSRLFYSFGGDQWRFDDIPRAAGNDVATWGDPLVYSDQGREVYVSESEPADWTDGDLWLQPQ